MPNRHQRRPGGNSRPGAGAKQQAARVDVPLSGQRPDSLPAQALAPPQVTVALGADNSGVISRERLCSSGFK